MMCVYSVFPKWRWTWLNSRAFSSPSSTTVDVVVMFNHRVSLPPPSSHRLLIFSFTRCCVLFFVSLIFCQYSLTLVKQQRLLVCAAAALVNFEAHKTMKKKNSNPPTEKSATTLKHLCLPVVSQCFRTHSNDTRAIWFGKNRIRLSKWRKKKIHIHIRREKWVRLMRKKSLSISSALYGVCRARRLFVCLKNLF